MTDSERESLIPQSTSPSDICLMVIDIEGDVHLLAQLNGFWNQFPMEEILSLRNSMIQYYTCFKINDIALRRGQSWGKDRVQIIVRARHFRILMLNQRREP